MAQYAGGLVLFIGDGAEIFGTTLYGAIILNMDQLLVFIKLGPCSIFKLYICVRTFGFLDKNNIVVIETRHYI